MGPGFDQPSQALAGPAPSPLGDCPARPPRCAPGRPLAPASLPAPLRAAALLGLALLAAAPPAQAAKPVLRTTNPVTTSGSQVTLHYDQTLASTKTPLGSQFTVTVGGQQVATSAIQASGIEVRVFVGFRIAPDEAVTIAYSKPTSGVANDPIQNSAGEEADSFSAKTATTSETWSATALDAAASQSTVSGDRVAIFFNAELDSSPSFQVPAGAFTVTVDGTAQTPGARNYVPSFTGGKGVIILRTLPTAIKSGQTVQVSYAPPLGAAFTVSRNRLWGSDDKLVQRFADQTITNNTALVANIGTDTQTTRTFSFDHAQAFTTGSRAIRLDAANLRVSKGMGRDDPDYTVSIHSSNASDQPGDSLGTLTNPAALPTTPGSTRFEAPSGGITLAAATTYFVVIDVTVDGNQNFAQANVTDSDDEDDGKTTDWSIADALLTRSAGLTPWGADTQSPPRSLVIGVQGAPAAPTLASAAVNGTALTLTFNAKLATGSVPAANAFTVRSSSGADHTGTGTVTINASNPKQVSVTLASAVGHGETLTVNYTKPGSSPLKDTGTGTGALAALEVATFSGKAARNDTPTGGTPPPDPPPPDTTQPDPQDPQSPQDQSGGSEQRPRDPQPLQLALWTDKPGYRPGETVRLYRSLEPHDDRGRYRAFAWLEPAGGGERQWLAPLSAEGQLHDEAVDSRGQPASAARPQALSAADRELAFEGQAPGPGLWQFVLELRPGEPSEQAAAPAEPLRTRRAWAKFAVAERSVLLNRSGFDREIRADMTLRADTLYYLGHQLFVHAGATLAIEPGTLLQAFGSHAAIIVEPGGRIVAEGTREAPVVLTCSAPAGYRQPGCWAGLRILGNAPVTRLEGVAPGVLPPERPAYGGSDGEGSSGALRYVRVEFAGASGDPEAPGPAIGLYGAGSGTVLDHVQARQSLGDAFAFHGGTAVCDHCVASGSGGSGLSWQRGWQGGAAHLYVQHGRGGGDGLSGGHDEQGHDREPRSLPTLSNLTLVHAAPYDRRARRAVAVRLADGTAVQLRDLLAAHFGGGALRASGRSRLLFGEGESSLIGALLWLNGSPQVPAGIAEDADFEVRDPKLRDVRDFADPDPRPKADSHALTIERKGYIGAFGRSENWLKEWTVFGPESVYDIRQRSEDEN